ncbi:MAG: hypothetical protein AB8E82_04805 [Aureispira sp.]
MFKDKTDATAFKSRSLDPVKAKTLLKGSIKRLSDNANMAAGMRAPFHLIKDYFKDEAGVANGDLLCVGINKPLTKLFNTVELKPGKQEVRLSENNTNVSMGEVYVKLMNGKKVVCFEPTPVSKMKTPMWNKALKTMKAAFGGKRGVVIIAGQAVANEEDPTTVEGADNTVQGATRATTSDATTTAQAQDGLSQFAAVISEGLKTVLPNQILPNIRAKAVGANDKQQVELILSNMDSFKSAYPSAETGMKTKYASVSGAVEKHYKNVLTIRAAVDALLGQQSAPNAENTGTATRRGLNPQLAQLLKDAETAIKSSQGNQGVRQEQFAANAGPVIVGGDEFLGKI